MCSNLPLFIWKVHKTVTGNWSHRAVTTQSLQLLLRKLNNGNDRVIKWLYHIILHVLNIRDSQPWGLLSIFSTRKMKCKKLQRYSNTKYSSLFGHEERRNLILIFICGDILQHLLRELYSLGSRRQKVMQVSPHLCHCQGTFSV